MQIPTSKGAAGHPHCSFCLFDSPLAKSDSSSGSLPLAGNRFRSLWLRFGLEPEALIGSLSETLKLKILRILKKLYVYESGWGWNFAMPW